MRCEEIESLLNEHADAALMPMQRQAVDEHVATCEDCRRLGSGSSDAQASRTTHAGTEPGPDRETRSDAATAGRNETDVPLGCGDRGRSRGRSSPLSRSTTTERLRSIVLGRCHH